MRFTELLLLPALVACLQQEVAAADASAPPEQSVQAPRTAKAKRVQAKRAQANAREWDQWRLHAAQRMVAANPQGTYIGQVPDVLLAIPVLQIELNADGSVRRIEVLRYPGQAKDTTQLAIDAVRRGAPYGNVSRLPKPWRFTETFLFDDERRFKPRSLD